MRSTLTDQRNAAWLWTSGTGGQNLGGDAGDARRLRWCRASSKPVASSRRSAFSRDNRDKTAILIAELKGRQGQVCLAKLLERAPRRGFHGAGVPGEGKWPPQAAASLKGKLVSVARRHAARHRQLRLGQHGLDLNVAPRPVQARFGALMAIAAFQPPARTNNTPGRRPATAGDPRAARPPRGSGGRLDDLARLRLAARLHDPQLVHRKPNGLPSTGRSICRPSWRSSARVVRKRRRAPRVPARAPPPPCRSACRDGPPCRVGHFLVLVRLHEQARPRPAEDRLQVGLLHHAFAGSQAAVEQLAVVVGGRGHVQRAFLAALDLEARDPRGAQGRQVVGQGQVLHREGNPCRGSRLTAVPSRSVAGAPCTS